MDESELKRTLELARRDFDLNPAAVSALKEVSGLFDRFRSNDVFVNVRLKVATLDRLYPTHLATSNGVEGAAVDRLAKWIQKNGARVDELLRLGDPEAEGLLERSHPIKAPSGKPKHLYSFASKYAHFSNPEKFAIWDGNSDASVRAADAVLHFPGGVSFFDSANTDGWYAKWITCVEAIRMFIGAPNFRETDKALYWWNGGK